MKKLLLLPGALGTSKTMQPVADYLRPDFDLHPFDYAPIELELQAGETYVQQFARNVLQYLDSRGLDRIAVFGYSLGGMVAAEAALQAPQRIEAVYSYGTLWKWNEEVAEHMLRFMDPDVIAEKLPHYTRLIQEWYEEEDWRKIVLEERKRTTFLGKNPAFREAEFQALQVPVHYRIGDKDNVAVEDYTRWAAENTPGSTFEVVPDSGHPVHHFNLAYLKADLEKNL